MPKKCIKCGEKIKARRNWPHGRKSKSVVYHYCGCGINNYKYKEKFKKRNKR